MDYRTTTWKRVLALGLICVGLGASSCTSPEAYRKAMEERDQEIARLREERAQLKNDRQGLLQQIDDLAAQLREANSTISEHKDAIEASSQPELDGLGIDYGYRNGMAVISIPSSITFGSGKADLSKEGKDAMRKVAAVLKKNHPNGVYSIEGHTDTDPIRKSSFKTNRELSLARATAVLTFLVEDCDIADEQCVVAGYGQYRPVDAGTTAAAKAKNRRVEIVVHAARR
ncbi:MAG: OmpA family protein [Planctomycetes bacterium]|nr:OmpA family protein [Planctomycetota bacterium]